MLIIRGYFRLKTIRKRMLFRFGFFLVPLLIFLGAVIYFEAENAIVPLTKDLSNQVLLARSSELGRLFYGYISDVRTTTRRNTIRRGDFQEIAEDLIGRAGYINSDYEMLFFADKTGNFITTTGSEGNVADRDYFKAVIHEGMSEYISDPVVSRASEKYVMVVAVPIFGYDGEIVGMIGATVLLNTLSRIAESINIGNGSFGYIVDRNALLIAHPNEDLRMSLNLLESAEYGFEGLDAVGEQMIQGKPGLITYKRPDGSGFLTLFHPIPHSPNWSLGVALLEDQLMGTAKNLMHKIVLIMLGIIVVVILLIYLISARIATPIMLLDEGVKQVSSGDLDHTLSIKTGDEIEHLAFSFNKMTIDLKKHIEVLQATTAEKERIEGELQAANKIQHSMLPRLFPAFPDVPSLDLYASMEPAREVGGDFYDFFIIDDNYLYFSIGDVSGKGVGAALFMVITKTILKNQALQRKPLPEIVFQTNNMLCSDNDENMFVTVFIGVLNLVNGELEYVCAGHNPPAISAKNSEFIFLEIDNALVLGGMEDYPYKSFKKKLGPGDMLFLYTDGVTEAMNEEGELYDNLRLFNCLNSNIGENSRSLVSSIREDIGLFVRGTPASDDITMLAVMLKGE